MAIKCSATPANGHIGKYAAQVTKAGGNAYNPAMPFALSGHTLAVNTAKGAMVPKPGTVAGVMVGMVQGKPGITGAALLAAMLAYNWQAWAGKTGHINPATGKASAPWCIGYIAGHCTKPGKPHLPLVATLAAPTTKPAATKA